jgi:hypothetical protein
MRENIKIIRMQSGEDIVASYTHDIETNQATLKGPMRLVFRRLETGKTMMVMMPWLPVEVMIENVATVSQKDILTVIQPKAEFMEYYDNTISEIELYTESANMEDLLEEEDYEEPGDDYYTDEDIDQLMEVKKKEPIH